MGSVSNLKDGRRFLPVHEVCRLFGPSICYILPASHALAGCDTNSSFFGLDKKSVFKLLQRDAEKFRTYLISFSTADQESAFNNGCALVTSLFDPKGKFKNLHDNLNKLRVEVATIKNANLLRIPPCKNSFLQHILRANLQTQVWMSSRISKSASILPEDYGWQESEKGFLWGSFVSRFPSRPCLYVQEQNSMQ